MTNEVALFIRDGEYYLASNKAAARISLILSKMRLKHSDMVTVRANGYIPMLTNGTEIAKVRINA